MKQNFFETVKIEGAIIMRTRIIPVASGKGGVGKTLLAANLSIALARMGKSVIAVDLDLGGSNLYTCLGVPNRFAGIGDYLKTGNLAFKDLVVSTSIENLRFIPGEGLRPFMANITHDQRKTIISEIRSLEADYIILDLGAGTSFSTLHFFGISNKGLLVTTFETPAIMNAVMFLRNFVFRTISGVARADRVSFDRVMQALKQGSNGNSTSVPNILSDIVGRNPAMAKRIEQVVLSIRPRFVFSMGDHPKDLLILEKLKSTLRHGLAIEADYLGFLFYDEKVRLAARNREVLVLNYPDAPAAKGIISIARRVEKLWTAPSMDGRFDLTRQTTQEYRAWFGMEPENGHLQNQYART